MRLRVVRRRPAGAARYDTIDDAEAVQAKRVAWSHHGDPPVRRQTMLTY